MEASKKEAKKKRKVEVKLETETETERVMEMKLDMFEVTTARDHNGKPRIVVNIVCYQSGQFALDAAKEIVNSIHAHVVVKLQPNDPTCATFNISGVTAHTIHAVQCYQLLAMS